MPRAVASPGDLRAARLASKMAAASGATPCSPKSTPRNWSNHPSTSDYGQILVGLWRVNERAFVVRHLLTDGELGLFDTNARMASMR